MKFNSLVMAVACAASSLFAPLSQASTVFATITVHPVPGSTVSAGGGGVLRSNGTADGIVAPSPIHQGVVDGSGSPQDPAGFFIAKMADWRAVSWNTDNTVNTVNVCYTLEYIGPSTGNSWDGYRICQNLVIGADNMGSEPVVQRVHVINP